MMKLWNDFRNYFYKKSLSKKLELVKTERIVTNLEDSVSIGIIYDSSNPDNDIIITKYAENLRKQGKTVDLLGFVNDTKTEHKADVQIFNKTKLSWINIPHDEKVEQFVAKKFDLLIAAFTQPNPALEYVAGISRAGWKTGTYAADKTHLYDLMINLHGKNDLSYLLEQTTHFLNQVKYDSK